jgi:hypothetical protein
MVRLLQHRVFEKFGEPRQLIVHHMVVYNNSAAELRRGAAVGAVGGVLGAAIASGPARSSSTASAVIVDREQFDAHAQKEHRRAYYSQDENPEKASVYLVYIDAEINGKRVFVRTIAPEKAQQDRPHGAAVEAAIEYFLAQY